VVVVLRSRVWTEGEARRRSVRMCGQRFRRGLREGVDQKLEVGGVGQRCSSEVQVGEMFVHHIWRLNEMEERERRR
jgi:hypothetical protein